MIRKNRWLNARAPIAAIGVAVMVASLPAPSLADHEDRDRRARSEHRLHHRDQRHDRVQAIYRAKQLRRQARFDARVEHRQARFDARVEHRQARFDARREHRRARYEAKEERRRARHHKWLRRFGARPHHGPVRIFASWW